MAAPTQTALELPTGPTGRAPVKDLLEDFERRHGSYLEGCRNVLHRLAREEGRAVSTDDYWALVDAGEIPPRPDDMHSNALGGLFSQDDRFRPTGWTRSARPEAHGNLLRRWSST